ncbi:MAG TPA: DUF6152 family protein [Gammaproteobacteria bacterium]
MSTMTSRNSSYVLAAVIALAPAFAIAHHTFGYVYNTSQYHEIEGEVIFLRWENPHILFNMRTDDGEVWEIESNSPGGMERRTITREVISPGSRFRLAGFPARNGDRGIHASNILFPDGHEVVLRPGTDPRWTKPAQ